MMRSKQFPVSPTEQLQPPYHHNYLHDPNQPSWYHLPKPSKAASYFHQKENTNENNFRRTVSEHSLTTVTPANANYYVGGSNSQSHLLNNSSGNDDDDYHEELIHSTASSFSSLVDQFKRHPRHKHSQYSVVSKATSCGVLDMDTTTDSLVDIDIPTSALTKHQHNKNLHLLRSWTDEGHYSRFKAMTIASMLYNRKVTEGDIQAELTPKEKFAYRKFCLEIEDKLEMITSREPTREWGPFSERTLRKIWLLYALYTKVLSDEMWDEGAAKSDITSRAIAHLVNRAVAGGPGEMTTAYASVSTPILKPVEGSLNPILASSLNDPIQAFLLVYGRYVSTGNVYQVERLRKLVNFNEITEDFFQKLACPPENVDIDTYLLLLRQQQQRQQKGSGGFTGYGRGKSNSTLPWSSSCNVYPHEQNKTIKNTKVKGKRLAVSFKKLHDADQEEVSQDQLVSHQNCNKEDVGGGAGCSDPSDNLFIPQQGDTGFQTDSEVKTLQRKIQMLDGKKRICLAGCRYDVFTSVARSLGFEIVGENDLWNINWCDTPLAQEKIMQMRRVQDMYSVFWGLNAPFQKTNHFPGMYEICRKDRLGRNLNRLKRLFPGDYNFFPETFDLPTEQSDLIAYARRRRNNVTFIIKPESGCQGKGIFLLKNLKKLSPFAKCVCQVYIPHPLLIDGYKFDQRIYVLITCVDPLRLYIYDEGIARFATVKYEVPTEDNLEVVFMHLTNYSLNKFSESYVREGDGSKRTLSSVYQWMGENGYDVGKLTRAIDEIVVKTILCASPTLKHNYKTSFPKRDRGCSCFELLGFDILIDRHLNPILLEVNHSPSFHLDLPVDKAVKKALLKDVLNMVYLGDELFQSVGYTCANGKDKRRPKKQQCNNKNNNNNSNNNNNNKKNPVTPEIDHQNHIEGLSNALQRQFRHEMKYKGQFRLIYSSERPGRFQKLSAEDSYCGYNVMSTTTPTDKQLVFDRDPDNAKEHREQWRHQRTTSTVKVTKKGQKYVETMVIDVTPSSQPVQKFREIKEGRHLGHGTNSANNHQQSGGATRSRSRVSNNSISNRSVHKDRSQKRKSGSSNNNSKDNNNNKQSSQPFADINCNYYDSSHFVSGNTYIQPRWSVDVKNKQK